MSGGELRLPDETRFWFQAKSIVNGDGLQFHGLYANDMPLTPLFYAALIAIFGESILIAKLCTCAVSAMTVYAVAVLTYRVCADPMAATTAAAITAVYPFFIFYSALILSETLFVFVLVLLVTLLVAQNSSNSVFTGVMAGVAHLVKPLVLYLVPLLLIWQVVRNHANIRSSAIVLLVFVITITPWALRNFYSLGHLSFTTSGSGHVLWEGNNPWNNTGGVSGSFAQPEKFLESLPEGLGEFEADAWKKERAISYIKQDPSLFLQSGIKKLGRFWSLWPNSKDYRGISYKLISIFSFGVILVLAIIGTATFYKRYRAIGLFLVIIGYFSLLHMLAIGSIRYRLPIEPFLIVIASLVLAKGFRQIVGARET